MSGFRLRLAVAGSALGVYEAALARLGGAVVTGVPESDPAPVDVYLAAVPEHAEVTALLAAASAAVGLPPPDFALEAVAELDWVAESHKALPPVRAGRFYVHGSHEERPPPAGAIPILIDANVAFGTGHHETTQGCLLALQELALKGLTGTRRPRRALDMGCGSGILAIAMARLWPAPDMAWVVACDLDPDAVRVTRENARLNGVGGRVRAVRCDSPRRPPVARRGPYDVIAANILAGPLRRMAGDLRRRLAPGGVLLLSGLLASQERAVLAPYRARGPRLRRRITLGEWVTLVLGA